MEKEHEINCLTHEVIEGSFVSLDGRVPQGFSFTARLPVEGEQDPNFSFPFQVNGINGEGRYDEFGDEGVLNSDTEFGWVDSDVVVETLSPADPLSLFRSKFVPTGYAVDVFRSREGDLHHWNMTLMPDIDSNSLKIIDEYVRLSIADEKDPNVEESPAAVRYGYDFEANQVIDDFVMLWPRVRICSEEGIEFYLGQMMSVLIDEADDVSFTNLNYDPDSEDYENSELHLAPTSSELIDGVYFKRYEFEFPIDCIVPVDTEGEDEGRMVMIGVLIKDCDDIDAELATLSSKIADKSLKQEDINRIIKPYIKICDLEYAL